MKKTIFNLLVLGAFTFFAATFTSCGGGCDEEKATEDATEIAALALEYGLDPTSDEKCQAYVDAVRDFVNDYKDCDEVEASDVQEIEDAIADLPCG